MRAAKKNKKSRLLKAVEKGIKDLDIVLPGGEAWAYAGLKPGNTFIANHNLKAEYIGLLYKDGFLNCIVGKLLEPFTCKEVIDFTANYIGCKPSVTWSAVSKDGYVDFNIRLEVTHFGKHPDKLEQVGQEKSTVEYRPLVEDVYPCEVCGVPRTKAQGGTVFTVCDTCWDIHYKNRICKDY